MKTLLQPKEIEVEKYTEDQHEDQLRDIYGKVEICGMSFDAANTLRELDPIAFQCSFNDSQEYETKYICPICESEYEEEEDALYCCQTEEEEN